MEQHDEQALQQQVDDFLRAHSGGERLLLLISLPAVLGGASYALVEHYVVGEIKDVLFIVLLSFATIFLALGTRYLRRRLCNSAVLLFEKANKHGRPDPASPVRHGGLAFYWQAWRFGVDGPGELLELVFDRRMMVISGLAYGALLGSAPLVLGIHEGSPWPRAFLMVFMFCANAVTGAAFYSVIIVLRQSWHLAKHLDVTFFERRSKTVSQYSRLLAAISVIGAVYIGLCQASVVFSFFSGPWVYGYAVFAIAVFIGVYYIPQIPIRKRLAEERDVVLENLDRARTRLLHQEVTPDSLDQLTKIAETESSILAMGLGLSAKNASIVQFSAIASALLPYLFTFFKELPSLLVGIR